MPRKLKSILDEFRDGVHSALAKASCLLHRTLPQAGCLLHNARGNPLHASHGRL
jgi:hypothetical protein